MDLIYMPYMPCHNSADPYGAVSAHSLFRVADWSHFAKIIFTGLFSLFLLHGYFPIRTSTFADSMVKSLN